MLRRLLAARRSHAKRGLAIYGFFNTESGVGQSARNLAAAIRTTGLPVSLNTFLPDHARNDVPFSTEGSSEAELDHALIILNADLACALDHWISPESICRCCRIGFFTWELPVFPALWSEGLARMDEIWVPSRFVAEGLMSATGKPVHVIPYPVPTVAPIDQLEARRRLRLPTDQLLFLVTFDFNSFPERKNAIGAIAAFLEAFPSEGPASPRLIVKCHGTGNRSGYVERMEALIGGRGDIQVIDAVYAPADIHALQSAVDVFVSLHRSEGFGLNMAECMGKGKAVIATAFSGNMDFMDEGNSLLVSYGMRAVGAGEYVAHHGQWWAEPDHDQAVEAMRRAAADADLRMALGRAATAVIRARLSPEAIGERVRSLISREGAPPR